MQKSLGKNSWTVSYHSSSDRKTINFDNIKNIANAKYILHYKKNYSIVSENFGEQTFSFYIFSETYAEKIPKYEWTKELIINIC